MIGISYQNERNDDLSIFSNDNKILINLKMQRINDQTMQRFVLFDCMNTNLALK